VRSNKLLQLAEWLFTLLIDFNFVFVADDTKNSRVQNAIVGCGCHSSVLSNKRVHRSKMM